MTKGLILFSVRPSPLRVINSLLTKVFSCHWSAHFRSVEWSHIPRRLSQLRKLIFSVIHISVWFHADTCKWFNSFINRNAFSTYPHQQDCLVMFSGLLYVISTSNQEEARKVSIQIYVLLNRTFRYKSIERCVDKLISD